MPNSLISRQLNKLAINSENPPSPDQWRAFLEVIRRTYDEHESDKSLLERSIHISSREMNERADELRALASQLQALFESMPDVVMVLDQAGHVTSMTRALGPHDPRDVRGVLATDLVKPYINASAHAHLTSKIEKNSTFFIEISASFTGNETLHFIVRFVPLPQTTKSMHSMLIFTDVTETKQLEGQLEVERAQAVESAKMRTLGEMAGGIAHEINTPLSVIKLNSEQALELLNETPCDLDTIRSLAAQISGTTDKVGRIISGLRTFARDGSEDPKVRVLATTLLEDCLSLCKLKLNNARIPITLKINDPNCAFYCRPTQIAQIVMNLVNNAADAIATLTERWIRVSCVVNAGFAEIRVTDSGNGIPEHIASRMMEPFYTTKPVGSGTGLGLSISKGLAENHGGSLAINKSSPNTEFILRIPVEAS